jgi:hypothetical protein
VGTRSLSTFCSANGRLHPKLEKKGAEGAKESIPYSKRQTLAAINNIPVMKLSGNPKPLMACDAHATLCPASQGRR